jgi:hypothetical protein
MLNKVVDMSQSKAARTAGLLYLLNAIFATLGVFATMDLIIPGDAVATTNNIIANEFVYLFAFLSNVGMLFTGVFLPLALYLVFKPVDKKNAVLFVILMLVTVPIMCFNLVNQFAALLVSTDANYAELFFPDTLNGLVMLFLDLEEVGYTIAKIFWGLWLLPLGYLAYKSDYMPKILGILLIISCFTYLIDFSIFFVLPSVYETIAMIINLPTMFFELAFAFWLLIKGVNIPS